MMPLIAFIFFHFPFQCFIFSGLWSGTMFPSCELVWLGGLASFQLVCSSAPNLAIFLVIAFLALGAGSASAQRDSVIVRPKEIHDVLVNPGMGITTFQRFNGQALNPPLKWSEEGPTERLVDAEPKPEFPPTSVSYCRWVWDIIEPKHGEYHWEIIDLALSEAREHGQTLAIRLMPYTDKHPLPDWYRSSGARRANKPSDKDGSIWQPDYTDPLFLQYWGELVAEAGKEIQRKSLSRQRRHFFHRILGRGLESVHAGFFLSERSDGYLVRGFSQYNFADEFR